MSGPLVPQVRRKPPAWAPHPQLGGTAASDAESATSSYEAEFADSAAAQRQLEDPLESASSFRPLQPAGVQQSAAAMRAAESQPEADGSQADEDGPSSEGPGSNGAAVSEGYSAAVVDGVPVPEMGSSNGSGGSGSEFADDAAQRQQPAAAAQPAVEAAAASALVEAGSGTAQQLAARVDVRVSLNVPPALRVVPGPLLGYAGKNGASPSLLSVFAAPAPANRKCSSSWHSCSRWRRKASRQMCHSCGHV